MPVDSYMLFQKYNAGNVAGDFLESESQVSFANSSGDKIGDPFVKNPRNCFEVTTFSFDVEQTINMSSQSSGVGAGKIAFNPFKVSRKIDKATPTMFKMACQGVSFAKVHLGFRKAGGTTASGVFFLRFDFKLVALKTISWSHDDESPTEDLEFEYGGLQIHYGLQQPDGSITPQTQVGWNKIFNVEDVDAAVISLNTKKS